MLLIQHAWSLLLPLAIVLPWCCVALPTRFQGTASHDDQNAADTGLDESSVEHRRAERSSGPTGNTIQRPDGPGIPGQRSSSGADGGIVMVRSNPNADRRQKNMLAVLQPTVTIIRSNVIGLPIPKISTLHDALVPSSSEDISAIQDVDTVERTIKPSRGSGIVVDSAGAAEATTATTTPIITTTTPSSIVTDVIKPTSGEADGEEERTRSRLSGRGDSTPDEQLQQGTGESYRSVPRPQHLKPPRYYPVDHESCRREMTDIVVRRGGCRKRVSIGVCTGTCMSKPVTMKKHPYVNYHYSACKPRGSAKVRVDMNDHECQEQRLEKGRQDRNKTFNDVYLLSAISCSCYQLPTIPLNNRP
ncbi:uncharacterized protein LOC135828414 [Sycon ciliatum]|uniref:uncharacterized protein LOC135828414 n=1 Tax=Sycon ciliatum TaxID=27933 RepID=UPI0031F642FE